MTTIWLQTRRTATRASQKNDARDARLTPGTPRIVANTAMLDKEYSPEKGTGSEESDDKLRAPAATPDAHGAVVVIR